MSTLVDFIRSALRQPHNSYRDAIGTICLARGFTHLGEVHHLRGLAGQRACPAEGERKGRAADSLAAVSRASWRVW